MLRSAAASLLAKLHRMGTLDDAPPDAVLERLRAVLGEGLGAWRAAIEGGRSAVAPGSDETSDRETNGHRRLQLEIPTREPPSPRLVLAFSEGDEVDEAALGEVAEALGAVLDR